jgi:hypothetical protein
MTLILPAAAEILKQNIVDGRPAYFDGGHFV